MVSSRFEEITNEPEIQKTSNNPLDSDRAGNRFLWMAIEPSAVTETAPSSPPRQGWGEALVRRVTRIETTTAEEVDIEP